MKLFCCYTRAHEALFRDYFTPSLAAGLEACPTALEIEGGDFLTPDYLRCIQRKVEVILEGLRRCAPGDIVAWSDVDVVFLDTSGPELTRILERSGREILFQREDREGRLANSGFFVCRASPRVISLFEAVKELLATREERLDPILNGLLRDGFAVSWGYLPARFYARSHGWPPADDIALYHANATLGRDSVAQKIAQLRDLALLRNHCWMGRSSIFLRRFPDRMERLFTARRGDGSGASTRMSDSPR